MDEHKDILAIQPQDEREVLHIEEGIELVIANAEKQVKVLEKILQIAISRTNSYDWIDQMGKPYLTCSGAEKLMPLFGVNLNNTSYDKRYSTDEKGSYYIYQYKGTFSWKGGSIEAIGACSSRDKFFAWDSKAQAFKPLHDVDETNIMKAAYTNMMVNGVTRLLGIRNLTWTQLEGYGVSKEKAARVEYKNGNAGSNLNIISEPQQKRLYAIGKSSGMPEQEFKEWLFKTYAITTTKEIKREFYEDICTHVQNYKGGD